MYSFTDMSSLSGSHDFVNGLNFCFLKAVKKYPISTFFYEALQDSLEEHNFHNIFLVKEEVAVGQEAVG
jgi:hypothetical protein